MILALQIILYGVQCFAFGTAVYRRRINREGLQRHFVYYLGFVLLTEATANILRRGFDISNLPVYNFFTIFSFLFFFYWFYTHLRNTFVLWFSGGFIIMTVYNLTVANPLQEFLYLTLYSGSVLILIFVIAYFYSLLNAKESIHFHKIQAFWICTGLLIYYIGVLPLMALLRLSDFNPVHFQFAITILNIFQYALIAKGLLCSPKQ
ncbi:hypothetical protein [Altibacter sp. HG106]|uniref:hypothetical protein n=1 Tax=Altibacter sp. HG106 TaxID=3023937 RepID=UPI0023504FE1|nr:hypothetical protein [Altibacter sp. HG106]MDC7993894.1 hypothetical protein [Altibacter sp. HG106]